MPEAIAAAMARHEGVRIQASRILGMEAAFLEVLDVRLREALKAARVRELDALVLAAAGSSDPLANQAVARIARMWGARHRLPVTAAFASAAPPATGEAVRAFRAEGKRHIAVASFFLAPGLLPDRAAELALEAGAVAVSDPLGRAPRGRPRDPGPLRRGRRRARPGLTQPSEVLERLTAGEPAEPVGVGPDEGQTHAASVRACSRSAHPSALRTKNSRPYAVSSRLATSTRSSRSVSVSSR